MQQVSLGFEEDLRGTALGTDLFGRMQRLACITHFLHRRVGTCRQQKNNNKYCYSDSHYSLPGSCVW